MIDLRVEGPDHEPPLCQNLSVHCNQGPPRGRAAHADPVGPFLTRPGLDVRGLVGSIRFLVPTGDCRLAAQCGAARLAPYKQPRAENLIEVLLTDLKSGEIRAETLTLAAPLPIAR